MLWWNITELEDRRVVAQVSEEAVALGYVLGRDLDELLATMGRFAEREAHRNQGPAEDEARLRDAESYLRDFPTVDWVALIDTTGWLWTLGARSGQAPDSRMEQVARGSLMERLKSTPGSTIVSVPPVGPGEQDLIAASPICRTTAGEPVRPGSRRCSGFALAGLRADRLISTSLMPPVSGLFITVRSGSDTLYRSSGVPAETRLAATAARLEIGGRVWEVSATPRAAEMARRRTPITVMVLLLGGTTSALLLMSLRFAGLARERAERVERQREELVTSEQRFRGVFDSAFQFQALLDLDCKVMELNRHGLAASEADADCMRKEVLWALPIWRDSPAAVEWLRGACQRAKDGRTTSGVLELTERDGPGRVYEATIRPLTDREGQVTQLVLEAQDITQMRRAEESIRELETLGTMGRLAARVAHEINNPLQGIQNGFQLIKGAIDPAHPHFRFVGAIDREITRIAGVTRQLYDAYRPEEESQRACSIPLMLSDVTALISQVNREAGVELVTEHDESVRDPVPVSDTLLRQIVMNLAQNAIDATPRGGVVTMSATRKGDTLALIVRDTGPGVPDHLRTRLFEPFFSTKSGRATSGMGLGLTLVRRATIALGGTIELQDGNRGGGATFLVQIPVPSVPAGTGEGDGAAASTEVQAPLPAGVTLSPQRAGVARAQSPAPPA
jgi:PAS domain S-box-containing protein